MAYNYLIASVSSLFPKHDCIMPYPVNWMGERLVVGDARVVQRVRAFSEGEMVHEAEAVHRFVDGKPHGGMPERVLFKARPDEWGDNVGYLEVDYFAEDESEIFSSNRVLSNYTIYKRPGQKCFFSDNQYKVASPSIIEMLAAHGRYVEGYPSVLLDRERAYGESMIYINPFRKAIMVRLSSFDGRSLKRFKVPAMSARIQPLVDLLEEGENRWDGRVQLTANNRLITFNIKHSLDDVWSIHDHEHMDPYRGEKTHIPLSRSLRLLYGDWRTTKQVRQARSG